MRNLQAFVTQHKFATGGVLAVVAVAASLSVPALAHDSDSDNSVDRVADGGTIIPEPEPTGEKNPIDSREELAEIERALDVQGSPAFYVCADKGSEIYTVVAGHEPPEDAKVNPEAGPVQEVPDPCEDRDWVVGR